MTEIVEMPAAEIAALPWTPVKSSNLGRIAHVPTGAFICSACGEEVGDSDAVLRAGDLRTCDQGLRPNDVPVVELRDLFVEFSSGGLYRYTAVPVEDYRALLEAHLQEGGSVGKTLHRRIKGRFAIAKVAVKNETEEGADSGDR